MAVLDAEHPAAPSVTGTSEPNRSYRLEIFLVSFAGLLLEITYTRVISFKLFYYYTYLIIGLALLGIGTGGVIVAVSAPAAAREHRHDHALVRSCSARSASPPATSSIALIRIDTLAIWEYDTLDRSGTSSCCSSCASRCSRRSSRSA